MGTTEDVLLRTRRLRRSIERYLLMQNRSATNPLGVTVGLPVAPAASQVITSVAPHPYEADDLLRLADQWVKSVDGCDEPARTEIYDAVGSRLPQIRRLSLVAGSAEIEGFADLQQAVDKVYLILRAKRAQ